MKSPPTALALVLLLGLIWPVAATAGIAIAASEDRAPLGWALLALVIVVTLVRPAPFADIAAAIGAAVVFVGADALQRILADSATDSLSIAGLAVPALALLVTPWIVRLLVVELNGVLTRIRTQSEEIDALRLREESGVFRTRFLDSILEEEIGRARRYRRSLTLGVISADDWSELVEDASAREVEALTQRIEEQLVLSLRPVDKAVAMGDGRWAMVLPETPLEGAAVAASRVQQELYRGTNIVMRIGLADFPRDAVIGSELIAEADQALAFARAANMLVVDRTLLSEAS